MGFSAELVADSGSKIPNCFFFLLFKNNFNELSEESKTQRGVSLFFRVKKIPNGKLISFVRLYKGQKN
jgi:hypothetical protein